MRLSSPEPSNSSTFPNTHRRRIATSNSSTQHRRHEDQSNASTSASVVEYEDEDEYSRVYSRQDEDSTSSPPANNDETPLTSYHSQSQSTSTPPAAPPYVNIAPLPIFRGTPTECPVAHLSRFERVCRANNATTNNMISRIFPVTLDGEASLWYELTIEPNPLLSWPFIKDAFLGTFRRPDFVEQSRAELMSLQQAEEEGVNSYHLRMQWILKRWPDHGIPDALLKGIFVDGLREDYQDWIVPQRPGTLQEAVRMALSWEQARSARAARRRGEVKCGFCDGGHEEEGCEVRRRMRELWLRSRDGEEGSKVSKEEGTTVGSSRRRSTCQCWKHQCWKKMERSSSVVVPTEENAGDGQ